MSCCGAPTRALVLAVVTILLLSFFAAAEPQAPTGTKTDGAYYVAYRTPAHVSRSSPDVFHGIANDTLDFLKSNDVNIIADPERGTIQTDELFSLDSLLNLTKNAGGTYLLYLAVDRPAMSWLKVTLQCYHLSGKLLWEEHASATSGFSGKGAPTKTIESLKKKLLHRIGQPGLPKVQKPAPATATPESTHWVWGSGPDEEKGSSHMKRKGKIVSGILIVLVSSVSFPVAAQEAPTRKKDPIQQEAEPTTPQPTQRFLLKEGTEVNLTLAQKLSAKSAFVGEPVELVLAKDLKVGDAVVVKQGARVLGSVVAGKESEKKRNEAHQLAMRVDFLRAGDAKIRLRGEKGAEGKRNKDAMIAGTIFLGLSGLLATSGKHYMIPEGSPVTAYVDEDIELQAMAPQLP